MPRKSPLEIICLVCLLAILVMLGLGRLAFLLPSLDWLSHFPATALVGSLMLTTCLLVIRENLLASRRQVVVFSGLLLIAPYLGSNPSVQKVPGRTWWSRPETYSCPIPDSMRWSRVFPMSMS